MLKILNCPGEPVVTTASAAATCAPAEENEKLFSALSGQGIPSDKQLPVIPINPLNNEDDFDPTETPLESAKLALLEVILLSLSRRSDQLMGISTLNLMMKNIQLRQMSIKRPFA